MRIDVLGAVQAWHDDGGAIDLGGPRHREVLARLVAAEGRLLTADALVADLWAEPGAGSLGALRTFVAALRRAVEPDRPPRTPPRLLVTQGPGYVLRLPREAVDVHRFQDALAAARRTPYGVAALGEALSSWRGPAYADFPDAAWAQRERTRLEELRLQGVELRAALLLDAGEGADLVAALGEHVAEHPWREPAWGLLARALHRAGRRADALATLRRARTMLVEQLGLDPGPELQRLQTALLNGVPAAEAAPRPWPGTRLGPRTTVHLARTLALAGGDALVAARRDRLTAVSAAERTGDVALTARVIGAYDVPAIWSRSDDPEQARAVVAAAERALTALGPDGPPDLRTRLLATVAVESRSGDASGTGRPADPAAGEAALIASGGPRVRSLSGAAESSGGRASGPGQWTAAAAAREAEALARELGEPALLAFALNGVFLQSFARPGLAPRRDAIGAELVDLAARHALPTFGILGRLVRLQSASALGRLDAGAAHAVAAEELAAVHESPLVTVLTAWFRARVLAARSADPGGPSPAEAAAAYRAADAALAEAGMPGLHRGLLPLALLGLRLLHGRPAPTDPRLDWGPHLPWARPLVLLALDDADGARAALAAQPEPPGDHLQEALWCLTAHAAARLDEPGAAARAAAALRPARAEHAGAASGLLTLGPVRRYLDEAGAVAGR